MERAGVAIIGADLDLGQGRRGVDMGPSAIRYAGLGDRLEAMGFTVSDHGNVATAVPEELASGDEHARFLKEIKAACERVARRSPRPSATGRRRSSSAAITRSRSEPSAAWQPRKASAPRSGSTHTAT